MNEEIEPKEGKILFYKAKDGNINLGVLFSDETVWLTQEQMVELFKRNKSVISKHIKNIFLEGELEPSATVAKFATVQNECGRQVSKELDYYNLDKNSQVSKIFYATLQDKLHWAITGHTAV